MKKIPSKLGEQDDGENGGTSHKNCSNSERLHQLVAPKYCHPGSRINDEKKKYFELLHLGVFGSLVSHLKMA